MISESLLRERLGGLPIDVMTPAAPDSTNNVAKSLAESHPEKPVLIAADFQTAGRGRQGRNFASPRGGLYLSVLLPTAGRAASEIVGVTSAAAVAVARAVDECTGCRTRIKWVNDILLDGGKLAGILCENIGDSTRSRYLVVGVGVNLLSAPTLPDAAFPPVSLADAGCRAEPETLAASIAGGILGIASHGFSFSAYTDEYRARSIVLGRRIAFTRNGQAEEGEVAAIDEDGALIVLTPSGTRRLSSGEIRIRPI